MIWFLAFFVAVLGWDLWIRDKERQFPKGHELQIVISNFKELMKHPAWPNELDKKVQALPRTSTIEKKLENAAFRHLSEIHKGGIRLIYKDGLWWSSVDKDFITSHWLYTKRLFGNVVEEKQLKMQDPFFAIKEQDGELLYYLVYIFPNFPNDTDCSYLGKHKDLALVLGEKECQILLFKFPLALMDWYHHGGRKKADLFIKLLKEYKLESEDTDGWPYKDSEGKWRMPDHFEHFKHKYFSVKIKDIYTKDWISEHRRREFMKKALSELTLSDGGERKV